MLHCTRRVQIEECSVINAPFIVFPAVSTKSKRIHNCGLETTTPFSYAISAHSIDRIGNELALEIVFQIMIHGEKYLVQKGLILVGSFFPTMIFFVSKTI